MCINVQIYIKSIGNCETKNSFIFLEGLTYISETIFFRVPAPLFFSSSSKKNENINLDLDLHFECRLTSWQKFKFESGFLVVIQKKLPFNRIKKVDFLCGLNAVVNIKLHVHFPFIYFPYFQFQSTDGVAFANCFHLIFFSLDNLFAFYFYDLTNQHTFFYVT